MYSIPQVLQVVRVDWPSESCIWVSCLSVAPSFLVFACFAGRALSFRSPSVFRLPNTENTEVKGVLSRFGAFGGDFCRSHGKPGGEDGGLEARRASSEKIALSDRGGVDDAGADDDISAASAILNVVHRYGTSIA